MTYNKVARQSVHSVLASFVEASGWTLGTAAEHYRWAS